MTPIAHTLLCASRYAIGRSLAPHREVIQAARELWPMIDADSRSKLLALWEDQIPRELQWRIEVQGDGIIPVSRRELEEELQQWEALFAWCREVQP